MLQAHKYILMTRSKVFATMFENDTLESSTNAITITDFDNSTIQAMLKYIYFGMTEDSSINQMKLFKAAARFELEILQRDSEQILTDSMDMKDVPKLLLCEQFYAPKMKLVGLVLVLDWVGLVESAHII